MHACMYTCIRPHIKTCGALNATTSGRPGVGDSDLPPPPNSARKGACLRHLLLPGLRSITLRRPRVALAAGAATPGRWMRSPAPAPGLTWCCLTSAGRVGKRPFALHMHPNRHRPQRLGFALLLAGSALGASSLSIEVFSPCLPSNQIFQIKSETNQLKYFETFHCVHFCDILTPLLPGCK